jgi:transcriptional regulator with XRE-family HTH domain
VSVADDAWETRIAAAHAAYPTTAGGIDRDVTSRVVNGEEIMTRLLRDLIAVDNVESRRGDRAVPDAEEGRRLLSDLRGEDYTVLPFPNALRALAGTKTVTQLCRITNLSRGNMARILNSQKAPTVDEIQAIAAAFGKRPTYFAEYRTALFAALVYHQLEANPDRSAVLAHQLRLTR